MNSGEFAVEGLLTGIFVVKFLCSAVKIDSLANNYSQLHKCKYSLHYWSNGRIGL